jgi:septum formation inhibitor MinC
VKTIKIDGIDYEVGTDTASQALSQWQSKTDAALATAEKANNDLLEANEKLQAKFDEAQATIAKKDAEIAELPKKLAVQLKARADLEAQAVQVLGPKAKLDADDTKLRAQVIAKLAPEAKLDGKSAAYIEARFDAGFEAFMKKKGKKAKGEDEEEDDEEKMDANDEAREDLETVDAEDGADDEERVDSSVAYTRMVKSGQSAWQATLKKHSIEVP